MYLLSDARKTALENPSTFYVPLQEDIDKLVILDYVKVIFLNDINSVNSMPSGERVWLVICKINEDGSFEGKLRNTPVVTKGIKYEDLIHFEAKHIIEIINK